MVYLRFRLNTNDFFMLVSLS